MLELSRLTSDYEKLKVNEELLQKELTSLRDNTNKREKEAKYDVLLLKYFSSQLCIVRTARENSEKELSQRISEMTALEDKLRLECSNEIERNNA